MLWIQTNFPYNYQFWPVDNSVVDPKLFVSEPGPDPTFQEISDPDPISDPT